MSFSFSQLFSPKAESKDGLSQPQREAIADLLLYCMYADNHLALAETKIIEDAIGTFDWEPAVSFQTYEARAISNARAAKENAETREQFFKSARERLNTDHARKLAIQTCKSLFVADGLQADRESTVLAKLTKVLA